MLKVAFRRMVNRPSMTVALAIGALFSVSVLSTIPIYTEAILQRLLIKELETYQVESGIYPGSCSLSYNLLAYQGDLSRAEYYERLTEALHERYLPRFGLPIELEVRQISFEKIYLEDERLPYQRELTGQIAIESMTDLQEHISLVAGHAPSSSMVDGMYEVVVSEQALNNLNLLLDRPYQVMDAYSGEQLFSVEVVGVFTVRDLRDPYWYKPLDYYQSSLFLDEALFESAFLDTQNEKLGFARWYFALDYHALDVRSLDSLVGAIRSNAADARNAGLLFEFPAADAFREYERRARLMNLLLSFLQTPLLLMIVFFVYMISHLAVQAEEDEIAVLRSRGGSTSQLVYQYLIKGGILAALAAVAGPPLGLFIARVLGSSNGFLEFVQRTALPVRISSSVAGYALLGCAVFLAAMILPVLFALRSSIVEHKTSVSRHGRRAPRWMRSYADIVLLAVSAYGLMNYRNRTETLLNTGAVGTDIPVDPLLFGISIAFIIGAALLTLRLFPLFLRLVRVAVGKRLPATMFAALVHAERSVGLEQFLMVFLILALSLGVYNATAARTINENARDRVRYSTGADLVIRPAWAGGNAMSPAFQIDEDAVTADASQRGWVEPPFDRYATLDGVEAATRVIRIEGARLSGGNSARTATLLAVTPGEFGRVAWMRSDLLPVHWFHYLNALGRYENGVLLSESLRDDLGVKTGDRVSLSWAGQSQISAVVVATVGYWPTFNPVSRASSGRRPGLIIANYDYIQNASVLQPYEIWLRARRNADANVILRDAVNRNLPMTAVTSAYEGIVKTANDPIIQSTNGVLTLGFLASMAICVAGFAIYWVLTLKSRELEFGVIRAMGIRRRQVTGMLITEQGLIAGTSMLAGALIGRAASTLFVPLLQTAYGAADQVPPFRIVEISSDFLRIYAVCGAMVLLVSLLFWVIVRRLRVHEVLKLSE